MTLKPTATCTVCGIGFYAAPSRLRNGGGKFCSLACRSKAFSGSGNARWSAAGASVCSGCGRQFHRKPSHLAGVGQAFCSDACRQKAYPEKPTRVCKRCGRSFVIYACHAKRAGVYCSVACASASSDQKVTLKCQRCGGEFRRKRSHILAKKGAGAFCSMECKAAWMSGTQLTTSGVNRNAARKGGKRPDLDGRYFRSSWEANYARYLNWQLAQGAITKWEFEPVTFEFPVKRGSKFYTPDFRVTYTDGRKEFHEIKGYMDQQSATKLKRMRIHYPNETVVLIDGPVYRRLAAQVAGFILNWEGASRGRVA